jgi:hypothetical protein
VTLLYDNFVRKIAQSFDQALSEIEAVYNFEFGDEFEIAICRTLRRVLPRRFGICRGYVVNENGECAGDDIVIYERIRFPTARLLTEDYSRKEKVPIEAVFAYIEAKHTLQLEGDGGNSLRKALCQVGSVKRLCDQRTPVPLSQVTQHINLGFLDVSRQTGWPSKLNPVYTAIISRQVRLRQSDSVVKDSVQIHNSLVDLSLKIDGFPLPDLIVFGTSNIALPVVKMNDNKQEIRSPFCLETGSAFVCRTIDGIAFGVALAHLLWALDSIELGSMPWAQILANSLGIPLKL